MKPAALSFVALLVAVSAAPADPPPGLAARLAMSSRPTAIAATGRTVRSRAASITSSIATSSSPPTRSCPASRMNRRCCTRCWRARCHRPISSRAQRRRYRAPQAVDRGRRRRGRTAPPRAFVTEDDVATLILADLEKMDRRGPAIHPLLQRGRSVQRRAHGGRTANVSQRPGQAGQQPLLASAHRPCRNRSTRTT